MNNGSVVRDYQIISLLGLGGMGEVYLAEEAMLGRKVAIKRLNPLLTNDAQFSERFVNEARIQAKLQHHNIVGLYNFFVEQGVYYMVMEYAPGITLKELIAQTGPIPEQRTLNIFKQIVDALGYAHAKEIIHRDIKPSNVLVDANDKIKIMDFGIARLLSDKHLTQTGAKVGTLFYMSPEQVKAAKDIDHRTDIYSAGIVLYEMLTGTLPFKADTDSDFEIMMEIVNHDIPNPREVYPHISDKTVATLNKATHKVREQRYQNCGVFYSECCGQAPNHETTNSTIVSNTGSVLVSKQPVVIPPKAMLKPELKSDMLFVEGSSYMMGCDTGSNNERPSHQINISSFYIGKCQITQKGWEDVMDRNPSHWKGDNLPVENVTWFEVIDYCNKRSLLEGVEPCYSIETITGKSIEKQLVSCNWNADGYRLPTEAEWEYAAKGGEKAKGCLFSGSDSIDIVAWYKNNSTGKSHPVGSKSPNEILIHDLSGNVAEWCWDWYEGSYRSMRSVANPKGPDDGIYRVLRGGSWNNEGSNCRVTARLCNSPELRKSSVGFRVVRGTK